MSLYIYDDSEFVTDEPYVFDVGEILDISNIVINDDNETISFVIDSIQDEENEACCEDYAFYTCFCELDTDGAWFEFANENDEDAFISNAYTFERVEPADKEIFDTRGFFQLFDIEYIKDGDFLCGTDANNVRVLVPRYLVRFVGY